MRSLRSQQLAQQVWDLRLAGLSIPEAAQQLGISRQAAWQRLQRAVASIPDTTAQQMRVETEGRVDFVARRARELLDRDTLSVAERVWVLRLLLDVESQRARLFGLQIPSAVVIRAEIEGTVIDGSG